MKQRDGTLVYTMGVNVNLQSMTIEEVLAVRQKQVCSPCNIRREGVLSLVIGGVSLVILEGKACNPL